MRPSSRPVRADTPAATRQITELAAADRNRQTGSSAAPSAEFALKKALALATNRPPKRSEQRARPNCSHNQSMVVVPLQHLPRRPWTTWNRAR